MSTVSEIPLSGADALVVLNALKAHASVLDALANNGGFNDSRKAGMRREAASARRILAAFSPSPKQQFAGRGDN